MKKVFGYFTIAEAALWGCSVAVIIVSHFAIGKTGPLTLIASLIGVTALIFAAKGNPVGQVLIIAFSALYGIISFSYAYYGEMITYLGMSAPMAVIALVTWLRNPYKGKRSEVAVNRIAAPEAVFMFALAAAVTVGFYFILSAFKTANIVPSTISVTTSFLAVYLTLRRSAYYALAYAANDVVLITLWVLAAIESAAYASVVVCFAAFLVNDIYGFINWQAMRRRQAAELAAQTGDKE